MRISIQDRKGRAMGDFTFSSTSTIGDVKQAIVGKHSGKYTVHQVYLTSEDKKKYTDNDQSLSDAGIQDNDILLFKDLGMQVSWRTVFLVEYFGPILIHSLFYFLPNVFYAHVDATAEQRSAKSFTQQLAFILVVLHYVKRELETIFVHRFSHATMPVFNIFKNSFHYWILSGLLIAYPMYHPHYTNTWDVNVQYALAGLFVVCELGNLHAHIILRNLRPPGTKKRGIPYGQLFSFVSCANYTWEVYAWAVFAVLSQCLTAYFFLLVSFGQIAIWALKKHRNYKKEFGTKYPKGRTALIPFIL
jgi:very-long-chain enoyl-CoA reductase